jgi:hypothetical protein
MEALAGVASIIAVVQIADSVVTLCGKYVKDVKNAKRDIERLRAEVGDLQNVLRRVDEVAKNGVMKLYTSDSVVEELDITVKGCQSTLLELNVKLEPPKRDSLITRFRDRAKWPFTSEEIDHTIETLNRHKITISLALNLDQRLGTMIRL